MLTSTEILRTVDDLGRIVIPRDVRRKLGLKSGDTVETFIDVAGVSGLISLNEQEMFVDPLI